MCRRKMRDVRELSDDLERLFLLSFYSASREEENTADRARCSWRLFRLCKKRRLTFVAICFLLFPFTALTAKSSTNNWRPAMKWTRLENVILSYQTISRLWVFADNWTFSSTKQKIIALRMKKHTSKKKRLHVNSRHLVRMLMIQVCNWNDGAAERAAWSDFADGSWWSEVVD